MRAIVVDDEPVMVRYFVRESKAFPELLIQETFTSPAKALDYVKKNPTEVAFLDVQMPGMTGIDLAVKLREIRPNILIVFISAYDYVRDSNELGGDYYLMKPYSGEAMRLMMERLNLIALRLKKRVYLHMFGTFTVTVDGKPVMIKGKVKEMLAFVALHRGKEVGNQTIFSALWEGKPYGKSEMTIYYHTLRRLRDALEEYRLEDLLISTAGGLMLNVDMVTCDYYSWLDQSYGKGERFVGEFLTEYSWAETALSELYFEELE